jgi:hypothetical protein
MTASHNGITSQTAFVLSNSNGISFGTAGSTVTASYSVPSTAGLLSAINFSAGTTSNNSASIRFVDGGGVSFGLNAGSITATVATNYLTSQSNQAFSASGGSSTFQTINFVNGNGATFTNNAGSVGISYTVPSVPAQTNQTLGLYASNNTTGVGSSTTVDARSFTVRGAGIISVGYSAGEMLISASAAGAGDGGNVLAAGTQTANTTGTVSFANSNGISWGLSNSSILTASYTVPSTAGLLSAVNFSAGTTSNNSASIRFVDGNGVTFGLNAGSISASVASQTVQTQNLHNVTLSGNTAGVMAQVSSGTLTLAGGANITLSQNGNAVSIIGGAGGGGGIAAAAGTQTATSGTVAFVNSNGVTFGMSGSTAISASVAAQSADTMGIYAVGNTTGASSSNTFDVRSLSFQGAGIISVGMTNGSVVVSASAAGAGDGVNIIAAGTQTANTTGTVVFSNSNGYSFGMSNNSRVTINGPTLNYYEPLVPAHSQAVLQGTIPLQPIQVPFNINATQLNIMLCHSGSSSAGASATFTVGIYTMSASTASLASSTTMTFGYNSTAAASSYSNFSGTRIFSFSLGTWNITPGNYLLGFNHSSSTSGTALSLSYVLNRSNYTLQGEAPGGGNYTRAYGPGFYSVSSASLPSSIHLTQNIQTTNIALRQPWFAMAGAL